MEKVLRLLFAVILPDDRSVFPYPQSAMLRVIIFFVLLSSLPSLSGGCLAAPPAGIDWVETFADEFNGTALESNVWTSDRAIINDDPAPEESHSTLLSDGILHLVTRHHDGNSREWTSASVSPRRFRQSYGYAEVKMRFARATGLNNLVMLATDGGPREARVEVVIVEGRYPSGISLKLKRPNGQETLSLITNATDFSAGYHLFGLSWLPDGKGSTHLIWYLDGVPIHQADCPQCNEKMQLWIGTHVTTWAGPFAPVSDGASMDVDYVRVYQDRSLMTR